MNCRIILFALILGAPLAPACAAGDVGYDEPGVAAVEAAEPTPQNTAMPTELDLQTTTMALTKSVYVRMLIDCGDSFNCVLAVMSQLIRECKRTESSTDCWFCENYDGPDECPWL